MNQTAINKNERNNFAHVGIGFSIVILLMVSLFIYVYHKRLYDEDLIQGKQDATRITALMRNQFELSLNTTNQLLGSAIDRQYVNMLFGGTLVKDLEDYFNYWIRTNNQYRAMFITDELGEVKIMVLSHQRHLPEDVVLHFDNHSFFKYHIEQDNDGLHIASIISDGLFKKGDLVLTRRVNRVDGQFGGVVGVVIDHGYLEKMEELLDNYTHSSYWIQNADGTLMLKRDDDQTAIPPMPKISKKTQKLNNGVLLSTVSDYHGTHIIASSRIKNPMLQVTIRLDHRDIFKDLTLNYRYSGTLLIVFTLFTVTISFLLFKLLGHMKLGRESESAALIASQAKTEFLAKMSHELRTPLNAIIGFSEMLEGGYFGPLVEKQRERVKDINMCGEHLLALINDILEFTKGEAGKIILQEDLVNISDVIEQVTRMMGQRAKNAQIALIEDIDQNLPLLRADERKMKQILINLVTNAIKFSRPLGLITVRASLDLEGNFLIMVTDNGIGMDPEDIPRAFSVFGQVGKDVHAQEGTGLGLPLCKMFTELHGGTIHIESARDQGTSVYLTFPASRIVRLQKGLEFAKMDNFMDIPVKAHADSPKVYS